MISPRRDRPTVHTSHNTLLPMGYLVQVVMWVASDEICLKGTLSDSSIIFLWHQKVDVQKA